jgi:eukaryotic-like serine/threonine-protein kinase
MMAAPVSLTPGTRLGSYEVSGSLGAGGMGEVYRARDAKLGRDVAIKILPERFVADADRVARFEREARTLAALNHPNIAQIYDSDSHTIGGKSIVFLAMEFVDGEDLAMAIARGKVPVQDALKIARQVASALEAAHEQGIVHRDLKPANIKIRPDGVVKVLDFGLAKALIAEGAGGASGSIANSPTMTSHGTELGLILGTAAYMSPEQARGKPVDRRADVWAFGVVLYEMLTGRRAFEGGEVSDVLASVLKDSLPFEPLPAETPASIRRLLRRCLQKDRSERLDSMATARLEISDALAPASDAGDAPAAASAAVASVSAPRRFNVWRLVAALAVAVAALASWTAFSRPSAALDAAIVRFDVVVPGDLTGVAITPSGDALLFQSDRLYVRGLADAAPRPIPGTDGARNLSVSPDGRWVAFNAAGGLRKVALAGGDPLDIASVDYDTPGAGWGPNNTLLYSPGWNSPMFSVSADGGGKPTAVSTTDVANGELGHWWPQTLPDQKSVLFTIWMAAAGINDAKIGVLDLSTGKHRVVGPGAFARYTSSGHLVYFHAGTYHAVKFDLAAMRTVGNPVRVLADVMSHDPLGNRQKPWVVSDAGTLVSIAGPLLPEVQWAWAAANGTTTPINIPAPAIQRHDVTADGRWLVSGRLEGGLYALWVSDLVRQTQQKIELPGSNFTPSWSPDGRFFVFTSMRKGHFDVWQYRMDEGRPVELIAEPFDQNPTAVSRDGNTIILEDSASDGTIRMTYARIDSLGQPKTRTVIEGLVPPEEIRFSPDDRWIAVDVRHEGRRQIVVRPFPAAGPSVSITPRGGAFPVWPRTGSTIFYQRDDEIVAVRYSIAAGRFNVDGENVVCRVPRLFRLAGIAPDGRFVVALTAPGQRPEGRVVLNWFKELPK